MLKHLQDIADIINAEQPDLIFLSEVIFECGPTHVNQAEFLAEATGMKTVLLGENYNVGLPFLRIVGGNAILSRVPITPVGNPSLAGRKPFYVTKNNRRILWGEIHLKGENVLVGAVHNDSFNLANNLTQMQQILEFIGERPAILGGDFNANPDEPPMQLLRKSGQFSGMFEGSPTFSTHEPKQTIDFIVAPSNWELLEHRVIQSDASDHFPIVSIFRKIM